MAQEIEAPEAGGESTRTALAFFEQGWEQYSKQAYDQAEAAFKQALAITPDYIDAVYGLGMVYQAGGKQAEAVTAFQKVIDLLEQSPAENNVRARMLARFSRGHINRITTGDWQMDL